MEGIADGFSVDSCYLCDLITPSTDECHHCLKRMRYLPAEIIEENSLSFAADAFVNRPSNSTACELAKIIWLFQKKGLPVAPTNIPSLDELRRWF